MTWHFILKNFVKVIPMGISTQTAHSFEFAVQSRSLKFINFRFDLKNGTVKSIQIDMNRHKLIWFFTLRAKTTQLDPILEPEAPTNVWCINNQTKLCSVLLLWLVQFLMHQTLDQKVGLISFVRRPQLLKNKKRSSAIYHSALGKKTLL